MTHILNPIGSSGFLIPASENKSAVVVDMHVGHNRTFEEAIAAAGTRLEDIGVLALTHLHSDHLNLDGIRALVERTACDILIPATCWAQHENDPPKIGLLLEEIFTPAFAQGRVHLLEDNNHATFHGWPVHWFALTHGVSKVAVMGGNLAYRFDDVLVTGDGPNRELFTADNLAALTSGAPITELVINLAHISHEDLKGQSQLTEFRITRYKTEHGLVTDLLAAFANPTYTTFFQNLTTLIPTHIRRQPRDEAVVLIREALETARAKHGFAFEVRIGNE